MTLVLENVKKKYKTFELNMSMTLEPGTITGLIGRNGAGKSTTFKAILGLIKLTDGKVLIDGKQPQDLKAADKENIGVVLSDSGFSGYMTVQDVIATMNAMYKKFDKADFIAKCEHFNIPLKQKIKEFSTGMKAKLKVLLAMSHGAKLLILDEPTSGVDPVARDLFWEMIIDLARNDKVTIFVTTHFMNEAARCDRISLMHAGKSLACDTPENLIAARNAESLEAAFIGYLEDAGGDTAPDTTTMTQAVEELEENSDDAPAKKNFLSGIFHNGFSFSRMMCCCRRECLELMRDPIRATLALFGALLLMLVMGFGINMDVEDLTFAVLDRDQTLTSNNYIMDIAGSRYFKERPALHNADEIDRRLKSGELSLAVEIPPNFARDIEAGKTPEVAFYVDGAMPSRAETVNGYISALHNKWLENYQTGSNGKASAATANIEVRYRYNPDVKSLPAMVPAVIPILLLMIPAVLSALAVVREKETGSIINLYVSPLSRAEFMLGKQIPYWLFACGSALFMVTMAVTIFDVPIKGSILTLSISLILYCFISTAMGLLASSVTRSQIAVIFLTMLGTILPAVQMCGMVNPVSTQTGMARLIGSIYPTTYMLLISRGIFNKALYFTDLQWELLALAITVPLISAAGIMLLKKQDS